MKMLLCLSSLLVGAVFAAQTPPPLTPIALVKPTGTPEEISQQLKKWCTDVDTTAQDMKWKLPPCKADGFVIGGYSVQGRPLVYRVFGNPESKNTTLILSTVHGDETTAFYVGLQLMRWLEENVAVTATSKVVLAPVVNPDGVFSKKKTRMNARGVDVNRNFGTKDWSKDALKHWKQKYASNPRRFPGHTPDSEPETQFQNLLIDTYKPKKILSVHAPLNFLDYDGPSTLSLDRFPKDYIRTCLELRNRVRAVSGGYFPGSLGNFAGQEKGIPTLTLELPSATAENAEAYWIRFRDGMKTVIDFEVPDYEPTKP